MPSRRTSSSSRSRSKSRGRSLSCSRSYSHSSRSRSRSRSRRARTPYDRNRLHISDIGRGISKRDLERVFEKYGRLVEVWQSRTVPAFAFVVFVKDDDAADAVKDTDGMTLNGSRIRVTFARPRAYERRRVGPISNMRCYSCNRKGHFSRDCPESLYGYKRSSSGRHSPRIFRSPLTRRYRSHGKSESRSRSRSLRRSVSKDRRRRQSPSPRLKDIRRSQSPSESHKRSRSHTKDDASRKLSKRKRKSESKSKDRAKSTSNSPPRLSSRSSSKVDDYHKKRNAKSISPRDEETKSRSRSRHDHIESKSANSKSPTKRKRASSETDELPSRRNRQSDSLSPNGH